MFNVENIMWIIMSISCSDCLLFETHSYESDNGLSLG